MLSPEASQQRIRIVLVEDHAILREGLSALLGIEPDLEVVGDAADAETALTILSGRTPQLVITDITLKGRTGIGWVTALRAQHPNTRVLVLTAHDTEEYIRATLNAGAHGYVLKDSGRGDLLQAIRTVAAGNQYLCPTVAARIVSGFVRGPEPNRTGVTERSVTDRERQVLIRIALGRSNKLIARDLGVSVKTVEKHRSNLMRKLTLHNAAGVTRFAVQHGFIALGAEVA